MSCSARSSRSEFRVSASRIWEGCFPELPTCTVPGCQSRASTVDPFFPYLDDHNRCAEHDQVPHYTPLLPRRKGALRQLLN